MKVHQSAPATCRRVDADGACFAPLQLVVTKSPIRALPYDELVVVRCLCGHIHESHGIVEVPDWYPEWNGGV